MKRRLTIMTMLLLVLFGRGVAQMVVENDSIFNTQDQMLLANELFESGEPFSEFLGYNLDNLDPMVLNMPDSISYTTGIENYEYSRYLLGTVISRSGLGLHMMWSPMVNRMAAMEPATFDGSFTGGVANGFKQDDELMKMIHHFGVLAKQMAPAHPFPQFAEFESGNMHLPQAVAPNFQMDFSSLRWDRSKMDKQLSLGAMGQTMLKQYFWAQDMLSAFHDSLDNTIEANGTNSPDSANSPNFNSSNNLFYGGNSLDGFIGQVLTAEAINKTLFLINKLAYNGVSLGAVNPATYNPSNGIKYFPHKIAVTEKMMGTMLPPAIDTLVVSDPSSHLFDQLSFLWASLNFKNMMDPGINDVAHLAYHQVFDGNPFPAPMTTTGMPGPFDLMRGSSKVIFLNTMAMHYNQIEGVFVDVANYSVANGVTMNNKVSSIDAAYMLVVLAKMKKEFSSTPLATMVSNALDSETSFLLTKLTDTANGGYYNFYVIGSGPDAGPLSLESAAAIVRGLYASYASTQNPSSLIAANNAYNYLINNFYLPSSMIFKTEINNLSEIVYTPKNLALLSGVLRQASILGGNSNAAIIYTRAFKAVYNKMLLKEAEQSGETGNDSDGDGIAYIVGGNLPFVFAAKASYSMPNAIEKVSSLIKIEVFPNPAANYVKVNMVLQNSSKVELAIYDISGRLMLDKLPLYQSAGTNVITVNTSKLVPGIYFLRIVVNNEIKEIKKLIINR